MLGESTKPASGVTDQEFDLASNAFHLLGAEPEDSAETVVDRYESAIDHDCAPEDALQRAQQSLMAPRRRLDAEVAWLVDLSANQRRVLLDAVLSAPLSAALEHMQHAPPLARANAAAHLCGRFPGQDSPIRALVDAWEAINEVEVLQRITDARKRAGVSTVNPEHLKTALVELRTLHSRVARKSIEKADHPSAIALNLVESAIAGKTLGGLVEPIIRDYDAATEGALANIRHRLDAEATAIRQTPDQAGSRIKAIVGLLADWDEINQPVQRLEQSQGHEEPRSAALCQDMRDLGLFLANEQDQYDAALELISALLDTFPELESVAANLRQDVSILKDLAARDGIEAQLAPIFEALSVASKKLSAFRGQLKSGGVRFRRGLLAELLNALDQVLVKARSIQAKGMAWDAVHSFAITLNNDHDDADAALSLLDHLSKRTPPTQDHASRLAKDREAAQRNILSRDLKARINDSQAAIAIIQKLLPLSTAEDVQELLRLKARLEQEISRRYRKRWAIALVIGAFGVWVLVENGGVANLVPRSSPSRTTSLAPPSPSVPQSATAPRAPAPVSTTTRTPTESYPERVPRAVAGQTLSTPEIRYCLYQYARIGFIEPQVHGSREIYFFNQFVNDYNARCGEFSYRRGALAPIEREIASRRDVLRADAQRVLGGWRTAATPQAEEARSTPPPYQYAAPLLDLSDIASAQRVQRRLTVLGYPTGGVDGVFGPRSQAALRAFKTANPRLPADAVWDLATQRELAP